MSFPKLTAMAESCYFPDLKAVATCSMSSASPRRRWGEGRNCANYSSISLLLHMGDREVQPFLPQFPPHGWRAADLGVGERAPGCGSSSPLWVHFPSIKVIHLVFLLHMILSAPSMKHTQRYEHLFITWMDRFHKEADESTWRS